MIGKPIVIRFSRLSGRFRPPRAKRRDLHTVWQLRSDLPQWVKNAPVVQRYLELLGPLAWDRLPERNLQRNWGQTTIPYASFIAAYLIKLNEGKDSLGDLRLYLTENPELIWLLGFPLGISNPGKLGFEANAATTAAKRKVNPRRLLPPRKTPFRPRTRRWVSSTGAMAQAWSSSRCLAGESSCWPN